MQNHTGVPTRGGIGGAEAGACPGRMDLRVRIKCLDFLWQVRGAEKTLSTLGSGRGEMELWGLAGSEN